MQLPWRDNSSNVSTERMDQDHFWVSSQLEREYVWILECHRRIQEPEELRNRVAMLSTHRRKPEAIHEEDMVNESYEGDFTIVAQLKTCAKKKDLGNGTKIHSEIVKRGLIEKNPYLASSVINMYVKCGMLEKAHEVHEELHVRNIVSWNTLISGYARQGQGHEALNCFQQMLNEGFHPDEVTFVSILKACASIGDIVMGKRIHDEIVVKGFLEKYITLGTSLVDMYAKCGMLAKAQRVLKELQARDVVCWSVLISEYAQQGQGEKAITCFEEMQCEGISADVVTYVCVLKACGSIGVIDKGKEIHDEIVKRATLCNNVMLGIALVDMYAKCGVLGKAQKLHDELCKRSVISWNALISGYVQQGQGHEAMNCLDQMQREGFSPDTITFVCIVKACSSISCFRKGKQIHDEIICLGLLAKSVILGTALVDMYAKFGMLRKSQEVLQELPIRDVYSWSALISGYTQQGQCYEALNCFKQMQDEGLSPNAVTFICILKACASTGAINKGEQIHEEVVSRGLLENDIMLGTALLDMYAKCGVLVKAREVFENLSIRDVVSWSALIGGYAQHGQGHKVLECLKHMQNEGFFPNEVTFVCILKACGSITALDVGEKIHDEITTRGLLGENIILDTALVDMYAKRRMLVNAQQLHDNFAIRTVVSWNALISGHVQQGQEHDALNIFKLMEIEGISPDAVTYVCILKACGSTGDAAKGKEIHYELVNKGLLEENLMLSSALVDMYAKCGMLAKAQQCHDNLSFRSVVSWNSLISGYSQQGQGHEALQCFEQMQNEGFSPDVVTFICVLKACSSIGSLHKGKEIYDEIVRRGMLDKNIILGTALMDMYAKCGLLGKAAELLKELPIGKAKFWNALISGYAEQGQSREALDCFERMQNEGSTPIATTFICVLKACGITGSIDKGKQIHEEVIRQDLLNKDTMLGTALVDMYAKCGALPKAAEVLEHLPIRDIVSWNALIAGYAQQGQGQGALECLNKLQIEGLCPDNITFLCVLSACSHSGLVEEAERHYESMIRKYNIVPTLEHQMCMVTVFGCVGQFDKAMSIVETMPSCDCSTIWLALLGACRKWSNSKLGIFSFDQSVRCGSDCGAAYVMMADIYADIGMQKDAEMLQGMKRALKNPGSHVWVGAR